MSTNSITYLGPSQLFTFSEEGEKLIAEVSTINDAITSTFFQVHLPELHPNVKGLPQMELLSSLLHSHYYPIISDGIIHLRAGLPGGMKRISPKEDPQDPIAQYNLAFCYELGKGVPQDLAQAVFWYRKAAEQGHAKSQSKLGGCYYYGVGIVKDLAQAVIWYRKSAEQGNAKAQSNLGVCYYNGKGALKDLAQAVFWYRKAAEQGDAKAQFNLGVCYHYGHGVARDLAQAVFWFREAADQGHAKAQANLAFYYENRKGNTQDQVTITTNA